MPYCRKCGTKNSDEANFCKKCGARIIAVESASENQGPIADAEAVSDAKSIPTFEPPKSAPTFTPPAGPTFSGPSCEWHTDEPAVTTCPRCGRHICRECVEAYTVSGGQYDGRALCYDCIRELIAEQSSELSENYSTIKRRTALVAIGVVIGLFVGLGWGSSSDDVGVTLIYGIACAAIGGSFANFCRNFLSQIPSMFTFTGNFVLSLCIGLIKLCVYFFIDAIKALIETVQKLISYGTYLSRTKNILQENQQALDQIEAFMQYTLVRSQNKGVDLDTLMHENSELFNNSYAQQVRNNGEQAADAALRQSATVIAANGEIVRNFAA